MQSQQVLSKVPSASGILGRAWTQTKPLSLICNNCDSTPRCRNHHPIIIHLSIMIAYIQTQIHLTRHTHMHLSHKKTHSTLITRRKTITCAHIHNTYTHRDITKPTNTHTCLIKILGQCICASNYHVFTIHSKSYENLNDSMGDTG